MHRLTEDSEKETYRESAWLADEPNKISQQAKNTTLIFLGANNFDTCAVDFILSSLSPAETGSHFVDIIKIGEELFLSHLRKSIHEEAGCRPKVKTSSLLRYFHHISDAVDFLKSLVFCWVQLLTEAFRWIIAFFIFG